MFHRVDSISAGPEGWIGFPLVGLGKEKIKETSNYSEVENGRECLRMTMWQGTVWERNGGRSQAEQLQEVRDRISAGLL